MEKGYSINQAAKMIGIKARTIREWIRIGRLYAIKLTGSRKWLIPESEIDRIREERQAQIKKN